MMIPQKRTTRLKSILRDEYEVVTQVTKDFNYMKKECWYFSICPQNKFQVKSNLKTQTEKLIFKKILELFFLFVHKIVSQ